jgi:kynurenine formamidase
MGVRVERIVDLSIIVDDDTQVFPGDPSPHLAPATTIEGLGANVLDIRLGSHTGTHVDAPYHFIAEGPVLEDVDLGRFIGPGVIVDVTGHRPRQPVTIEDLAPYQDRLGPGVVVTLHTGWSDRYLGTGDYLDHPYLDPAAARHLLSRGVRTVAIDALNIDQTSVDGHSSFPTHMVFLGAGGVLVENLTNLSGVDFDDPLVSFLPVRLGANADGAPCRAVALRLGR